MALGEEIEGDGARTSSISSGSAPPSVLNCAVTSLARLFITLAVCLAASAALSICACAASWASAARALRS